MSKFKEVGNLHADTVITADTSLDDPVYDHYNRPPDRLPNGEIDYGIKGQDD